MGQKRDRLPKGPQPEKLLPDERVMKQGSADLQNGWLGRHGTLSLTDTRMVFVPTPLDTLLRGRRQEMRLDEITEIERYPIDAQAHAVQKRPRILVHTPDTTYQLMVGDMDSWIDTLEIVYRRRERNGEGTTPKITRKGYTNFLLEDE